jgi:uncharacterized protein (DUF305 family)
MRTTRLSLTVSAALATCLVLVGCAAGSSPGAGPADPAGSPAAASTANDADIRFARMMIPHHEQAVEMSETLLAKTGGNEEVRTLATEIIAAQQPEIDQFESWLAAWGGGDGMDDMDHGSGGADHDMEGMMSADEMQMLDEASGTAADRLYLEQMIRHHEGAVTMARTEVDEGENPQAVALAGRIASSQSDEIALMQSLLNRI